jgi:alpha-D-xyloside xylohydrolase
MQNILYQTPLWTLRTRGLASFLLAMALPFAQAQQFTRQADGITVPLHGQTVRLQVVSDSVIHVLAKPDGAPIHPSITVVEQPSAMVKWAAAKSPEGVTLTTARIMATVDGTTGAVTFFDRTSGQRILAEDVRTITPATVLGEPTWNVQQQWKPIADEGLYGLGQQQLGIVDLKGYDLDLWQHNTNVVVPFLVSSRGYGVFWDNTSFTRFGDLRPFVAIPSYELLNKDGIPGGLTLSHPGTNMEPVTTSDLDMTFHPTKTDPRAAVMEWTGTILPPVTGDYQLRANFNGGLKVWIHDEAEKTSTDKPVIDHWLQTWLTADNQTKLHFVAGHRYAIRMLTDPEQETRMSLLWKTPASNTDTSLWSEVGDGVSYYFVYGPKLDDVIAGYRGLTGRATMMPRWIFGLWQSRQRYETQQQSLDVVNEFRTRKIPFDNIVQDWQYWKIDEWGSQNFDPARFPDPDAWIKSIHDQHAHLMISVWGKYNPNTENAKEMNAHGFLYQPDLDVHMKDWLGYPYTFYDAFNPAARKLFWKQLDVHLFPKGIDAWWMDASEPDLLPGEPPDNPEDAKSYMNPTAMGTGARMMSGWGLMNADSIYSGQRGTAPNQRVFILTRSGYAGQQRYSTATWSGDVTSTWTALAKQIPAGLGISIAGVPYWTTDTAGYTMQEKFFAKPDFARNPADEDEFRELNARWFEFSTFTPMLRVHGEVRPREMWLIGKDPLTGTTDTPVYNTEVKFDRIRYHLFPYIYSLAGAVTQHDDTMMRPLVMDFPADEAARALTDEYMFGPSLLIAPITSYKERSRPVYLPGSTRWYNLWTGSPTPAGNVTAAAPYDAIPVFVRAGSIIPLGPDQQYIGEKPSDPITLHVYEGANGSFTLYEDNGLTFDYEHGAFTEIPITWNEAEHTLTIGQRKGSFPEMLAHRTFQIVVTSPSSPTAFSLMPAPVKSLEYNGTTVSTKLP